MKGIAAASLAGALAACATVPTDEGRALSDQLEASLGAPAPWPQSSAEEAARAAIVSTILAEPLTPDSAVRVALANNARVLAAFESLGVARADYLNAVYPPNPFIGFMRIEPNGGGDRDLVYSAGFDVLDLLLLPWRGREGAAHREAAAAQAATDMLAIAAEAREAAVSYIAANQEADLLAQAADAADAAADAAEALFAAGNVAAVDAHRERLFAEEVQLDYAMAQARLAGARERVNAALGLDRADADRWRALARLPAPPREPIPIEVVAARASSANLDLRLAQAALGAARARRFGGFVGALAPGLGAEAERERDDGDWRSGFGVHLTAPLFDLGGRERLRLGSIARREEALASALGLEVAAQARALALEAEAARTAAVRRREVMLPLSAEVFEGAQRDFNAMEIGLIQLLDAKRQRLEDGLASVRATRDYWLADGALQMMLAGAHPKGNTRAAPDSPDAGAPDRPGDH